jgi:23S rRNA (guanosine2251-2'-O)-methyltransferase
MTVKQGRYWIYGLHAVNAALGNPARVAHRLVATAESAGTLQPSDVRPEVMSREALARLLPSEAVHQGAAVLVDPLPERDLDDTCRAAEMADRAVLLVLDQITDPHNVGAILRTAAAFGALAVITTERHAAPESGALAKAASGTLETVPLVRVTNLAQAIDTLRKSGIWCVGLSADGDTTLSGPDLPARTALVLGAEGVGLRRLTRERCDEVAKLALSGAFTSLNVSNACAVALYEATRSVASRSVASRSVAPR